MTLAIAFMLCGTHPGLPGTLAIAARSAPALPDSTTSEPAPVAEPEPEPVPEPAPEPEPTPEPEPSSFDPRAESVAHEVPEDPEAPPRRSAVSPVDRSEEGMWAMQFTFGGLAPMSIAGVDNHGVNRLLFTELGFRRVFKRVVVPFSIGAGIFHHNPETGGSQNDAGLAASVSVLVPFRAWRRIVPYAGGGAHFHYLDPTGDNNWLVNVALGPVLGIEYFIAHRVSLILQGQAYVGINVFDGLTQVSAATSISGGGQLGLVFYF